VKIKLGVISRAGIGAAIFLAAIGIPAEVAAAAQTTATTQGLSYVALGDSYAAGLGLAPPTGTPDPSCGQAAVDYPHQVAAALGLQLTDVSCSGATTAAITGAQGSNIPAQASALSAATSVVSVTIGGNDLGFASIAQSCIALSPVGPLAVNQTQQSCKPFYVSGSTDSLQLRISGVVVPNLRATFAAIKAAAPNAKVFVVGYHAIMPANLPTTGCYSSPATANSFPFEAGDTAYLYSVEQSLDAAIQSEASTAGFAYVPASADQADHSACAPAATAYVNGVTASPSQTGVAPGSLHPNAAGVASYTSQLSEAISAAFPALAPTPVPTATPTPVPTVTAAPTPVPTVTAAPIPVPTAAPVLAQTGVNSGLLVDYAISAITMIGFGLWMTLYSRKRTAAN